MTKQCMICKASLNGEGGYNTKNIYTVYSNISILSLIENVISKKVTCTNFDICVICYELIKELDYLKSRCEVICEKLGSQLGTNAVNVKTNVICQTDIEHTLDPDIRGNYKNSLNDLQKLPKAVHECCKCKKFSNEEQLKEHKNKHVTKQYECNICCKNVTSTNGFSTHIKNKHPSVPTFKQINEPGINDKQLKNQSSDLKVTTHLFNESSRLNENDTVATDFIKSVVDTLISECIDSTPNPKQIESTRMKKNPDILKPYECSLCGKAFKTRTELKSHTSTHNHEQPFICEICGRGYKNKRALNIHIGMHNGINPFTCVFCKKSFTQKSALGRHMPIHTGDAPYQCDLCGKRFVHHTSFNIHRLSHTGKKLYKCEICGLDLFSGSHLKRHMRVHTGERNYACPTCGKRFAERYNLVSHQKLHENSTLNKRRTYGCQICGTSYERKMKLEEHLANEHQKITIWS